MLFISFFSSEMFWLTTHSHLGEFCSGTKCQVHGNHFSCYDRYRHVLLCIRYLLYKFRTIRGFLILLLTHGLSIITVGFQYSTAIMSRQNFSWHAYNTSIFLFLTLSVIFELIFLHINSDFVLYRFPQKISRCWKARILVIYVNR